MRLGVASVKNKESRDRRGEMHSQMERKVSRKNTKPSDENDYKSVINRLVR